MDRGTRTEGIGVSVSLRMVCAGLAVGGEVVAVRLFIVAGGCWAKILTGKVLDGGFAQCLRCSIASMVSQK